jgi:hypothetical protein
MLDKDKLADFFEKLNAMKSEDLMTMVDKYMDEDTVEMFVDHIEDFYGVQDDEELGTLAQLMITGFIAAKEIS